MSSARVFVDGEHGTTGLQIVERLRGDAAFTLVSIDPARRKDPAARRDLYAAVDVVVLCLPDDAAKEAVALADSLGAGGPRIIDASSAHRVAPGWVYGFAELSPEQPARLRSARRVTNPGCYPTGFVALVRPLVDAGIVPREHPLAVHAVSGYSGGGRSMIEDHEQGRAPNFELYALKLEHKHLPEMVAYTGLTRRPVFVPSVGHFRQGMLVSVALHTDLLPGSPSGAALFEALRARYEGSTAVRVVPVESDRIEPEALNNSDALELRVYANDARRHAVLVARLDNLGKGASGAAVQNLRLMTHPD